MVWIGHSVAHSVGPNRKLIVVVGGHDTETFVAMLGVVASEHMYVPIDLVQEEQVSLAIISAARPAALLASAGGFARAERLSSSTGIPVLTVEQCLEDAVQTTHWPTAGPNEHFMELYASGTTGSPKTARRTHYVQMVSTASRQEASGIDSQSHVSIIARIRFGASRTDLLSALLCRATASLYDLYTKGTQTLAGWAKSRGITHLVLTPTAFRRWLHRQEGSLDLPELRCIGLVGEPL